MVNLNELDPELLAAVNGWKQLSHTELAVVCQAFYSLATHGDCPQWVRDTTEGIAQDVVKKTKGKQT